MRKLGLKGMQIGSNINGKNLDDPEFEPVWQVANEHNAFCMVHPNNVAGIDRLKNYYLNNLIGNPLDTTIAAACLVFGGVIERFPNIRFYMVHGGGFTPYQAGPLAARLARAARAEGQSQEAAGRDDPHLLLGHHPALEAALEFLVQGVRRRPRHARQRLSLRHGHVRMRAAGQGAVAAASSTR